MATRAKIATCTNCRQMKVKCDAKEIFPAPCSRCSKQKLDCRIDPGFQRTAKRRRVIELEQELRGLKAADANISPGSASRPPSDESPLPLQDPGILLQPSTSTYPEYSSSISGSTFVPQQIGDIHISSSAIADIINFFFTNLHDDFPILPDLSTFVRGYNRCSLLFWVIIAIASKNLEHYRHYHDSLEPRIQSLATDITSAADHPLGTVQALLLLCWWPFPFQATRNDPSWSYCGLATHTALRAGLHRPHHFSDFVYNDRLDSGGVAAFQRAWVGCFIVNQMLSSELGVPATMNPDATIVGVIKSQSPRLPCVLEKHLQIAYQSHSICNALGNSDATPSGLLPSRLTMMKIFLTELRQLESEFGQNSSGHIRMALLRVKLQLHSFAFTEDTDGLQNGSPGYRIPEHIVQAGLDSIQLIEIASSNDSKKSWPAIARISVFYASHTLLRLLDFPDHLDNVMAMKSIHEAWRILNSRSEQEHDNWARIRDIITYLSRKDSDGRNPALKPVTSRMAANITVDSIWRARERFSDDVRRVKPSDYTATAAMRDVFQFGLDFVGSDFLEGIGIFSDLDTSYVDPAS